MVVRLSRVHPSAKTMHANMSKWIADKRALGSLRKEDGDALAAIRVLLGHWVDSIGPIASM